MKRAVYYVARLISSQKEKEFHGDDYNSIKKVYSIWIMMDVQNYRANSIQEYSLTENVLHGTVAEKVAVETEKKSKLEDIRNLMESLNFTVQQAMNALKIPLEKQNEYRALI